MFSSRGNKTLLHTQADRTNDFQWASFVEARPSKINQPGELLYYNNVRRGKVGMRRLEIEDVFTGPKTMCFRWSV